MASQSVAYTQDMRGAAPIARWMGLRTQMTRSYIAVTLVAVAVSEALRYVFSLLLLIVLGRPLPPIPWYILLGVDLYLLIFVPLIGGLFGAISTRRLIRRIRDLAAVTARFAAGDYDQRLPVRREDEVGQLERHFNEMAAQLTESIDARQQLAERGARQEERARIARDLHDSVKQQTFAVSMQISAALAQLERDPTTARTSLIEAEALAYQVQQELTVLIQELRPPALREDGLGAALRDYVTVWGRQQGITVDLHAPDACAIPPAVEVALLRVAQEALSNVARHSGATAVRVALACAADGVTLSVADNGRGFASGAANETGVGLHSMRERMEMLGGALVIESAAGQGTRLCAQCKG